MWLTARTLTYKLRQQGYDVTPDLLRKWAERGKIRSRKLGQRENSYELTGVYKVIGRE